MKTLYSIFAALILVGSAVPLAQSAVQVSVDFFHDHLEPYGDWREVGDYGWCWQPRDVSRSWRPYSDGRWLYTDAGWTWDSNEPYSWAVYHYGRWARVDRIGWVWVPGTEWGPAWVSWRRSARHVGWAPLPPEARFTRSAGFDGRVDADYDIGPTYYNFVVVRNFGAPRLRTVIVVPEENMTIIRQTTNITRITYVNNVVFNEGPQYDVISRESALPIRRLKLERREEFDGDLSAVRAEQLRPRVEGNSLRVLALPIDTKPATAPRKVAARVEKAEVDRGWKNAGPPAEVDKLRAKIKSEPAPAADPQNPDKTAEAPGVTPVPPTVPDAKPPKGKLPKDGETPTPVPPGTTDVPPVTPAKPVLPDSPAKPDRPDKGPKPEKPDANPVKPTPPVAEEGVPPKKFKKGGNEAPVPPAEPRPQDREDGKKPKGNNTEPKREVPEPPDDAPRKKNPGKAEVPPPADQPPVRPREPKKEPEPRKEPESRKPEPRKEPEPRNEPKPRKEPEPRQAPEPRPSNKPESRQPAAPPATPVEPGKPEGNGKSKDKKKDEKKRE